MSWRGGSSEGFGKYRVSKVTGYINHGVGVEDGKNIVWNREDNDYGIFFCMLKWFIGMFYRGVYGSELSKKRRYGSTWVYDDETSAYCDK